MTDEAKKLIEENIELIDMDTFDSWSEFFSNIEHEVHNGMDPEIVPEMRKLLNSVDIDPLKELDYIPNGYYYEDPTIENITIPSDIVTIKSYAFYACRHMKSIKMPSTLLTIEENAFQYCAALEHIEIPIEIEFIHSYAFDNCGNLKRVIYSGTKEQFSEIEFGDEVFSDCESLKHISCLDGIIEIDENGEPII